MIKPSVVHVCTCVCLRRLCFTLTYRGSISTALLIALHSSSLILWWRKTVSIVNWRLLTAVCEWSGCRDFTLVLALCCFGAAFCLVVMLLLILAAFVNFSFSSSRSLHLFCDVFVFLQNSGWVWHRIRIALNNYLAVWPINVIPCQSSCGVRVSVLCASCVSCYCTAYCKLLRHNWIVWSVVFFNECILFIFNMWAVVGLILITCMLPTMDRATVEIAWVGLDFDIKCL